MNDTLPVFSQDIFRECCGWQDKEGNTYFAKKHEKYFLIPIIEFGMPDSVPSKKRCGACQLNFKRHRGLVRVRRHRIEGKRQEALSRYINLYEQWSSGDIQLDKSMVKKLRTVIMDYGGSI